MSHRKPVGLGFSRGVLFAGFFFCLFWGFFFISDLKRL